MLECVGKQGGEGLGPGGEGTCVLCINVYASNLLQLPGTVQLPLVEESPTDCAMDSEGDTALIVHRHNESCVSLAVHSDDLAGRQLDQLPDTVHVAWGRYRGRGLTGLLALSAAHVRGVFPAQPWVLT